MGLFDNLASLYFPGSAPGLGLLGRLASLGQPAQADAGPQQMPQMPQMPQGLLPQSLAFQPTPGAGFPQTMPGAPPVPADPFNFAMPGATAMRDQGAPAAPQSMPLSLSPNLSQLPAAPASAPQGQQQEMPQQPGFLSGLFNNNGNTLMALGAGIASGGLMRGLPMAAQAQQVDRQQQLQMQGLQGTYRALIASGVPEGVARAAALNPEILKTVAPQIYTKPQFGVIGEGPLGKQYGWIDPSKQSVTAAADSAGGNGSVPGGGNIQLLAPGVKQFDPNLSGEDYLNQFSPEVKAAVRAYINGDVMPTGNPRQQGISNFAKTVAQKYGQDTGAPVSDITYAERRKLRTDLASSGNSSMGGILSNGESSFTHLAELGDSMSGLGNASHDFPGGGPIAHAQNYIGNVPFASSSTQGKIKAINDNLTRYGEESTKFYAGSGGGEAERLQALHEMNPQTTSSEEMAAYLEKEKSLMLDRLNTKYGQIRQTLGEEEGNREIQKKASGVQRNIDRIDANIARLRGQASNSSPSAVTEGATATNPQTGERVMFTGGKWQPLPGAGVQTVPQFR